VFLEGKGTPGDALLAYLEQRAVGGGGVDGSGNWRIPLRMQEEAGIYPLEVRVRGTKTIVARFNCYVDQPIGSTPTPTPTANPTGQRATLAPTTPAATTATTATPNRTISPTPTLNGTAGNGSTTTPTSTFTPTVTGTPPTATPTVTGTPPTATPTTTGTPATATPTGTGTNGSANARCNVQRGQVDFDIILAPDLEADPPDYGTAVIMNISQREVQIEGCVLANKSVSNRPTFTFPRFSIAPGNSVTVLLGVGESKDDFLFSGRDEIIWDNDDTVVLRTPQGTEIADIEVD
jgi:hypothetical protein